MALHSLSQVDFQNLFQSSPGLYLILTADPSLEIVAVSDAYLKATMTKRSDIIGHGLFEIFPDNPDDPQATGVSNLKASLYRVIANQKPDIMEIQKYDIRRPESEGGGFEERHWSPYNSPVFDTDGKIVYIIHRVEDVTEFVKLKELGLEQTKKNQQLQEQAKVMESEIYLRRNQLDMAKAQLRKREELQKNLLENNQKIIKKLRDILYIDELFENSLDAVIGMDHKGSITHWNVQAKNTFGWTKQEALGRKVSELIIPARCTKFEAELERFIQTGKAEIFNQRLEMIGLRKDGIEIPMEITLTPIGNNGSTMLYGFARDISERKKFVEDLLTAKEAAETANRTKDAFLANMSHEIRTPLGVVIGFSDLLTGQGVDEVTKANYMETIKRNGEYLSNIIDDILNLSKMEAGKLRVEKREVALKEIILDVLNTLTAAANKKNINLILSEESVIPKVIKTDPLRLKQILLNIIGNAIKFTESGTVEIKTEIISGDGLQLVFIVKDTGIGISPDQTGVLFQAFSQADISTTRRFGGTGLGLILSKRLAHLLGGDVTLVKSTLGEGSTFKVTIDPGTLAELEQQSENRLANQISAPSPQEIRLDGVKILLIEDSPENQTLVRTILELVGATVDIAENGSVGLEKARSKNYDVLLMDLQMPVMDGYEATSVLRKEGYVAPIIALTAHALREERLRCLAGGFDDHITKPVDRNALFGSIARYCMSA